MPGLLAMPIEGSKRYNYQQTHKLLMTFCPVKRPNYNKWPKYFAVWKKKSIFAREMLKQNSITNKNKRV